MTDAGSFTPSSSFDSSSVKIKFDAFVNLQKSAKLKPTAHVQEKTVQLTKHQKSLHLPSTLFSFFRARHTGVFILERDAMCHYHYCNLLLILFCTNIKVSLWA